MKSSELFCQSPEFKKKHVFLLRSFGVVPSGTAVEKVDSIVASHNRTADLIATNLVKIIASRYFTPGKGSNADAKASSLYGRLAYDENIMDHSARLSPLKILWLKDNEFIVWDFERSPSKILTKLDIDFPEGRGFNRSRFCYELFFDTLDIGNSCGGKEINGIPGKYGCGLEDCTQNQIHWEKFEYKLPKQSLLDFIDNSSFNLGHYLDRHYFVIPPADQDGLCHAAGEDRDCMSRWEQVPIYNWSDSVQSLDQYKFAAAKYKWPHIAQGITTPKGKTLWFSALTVDLLLNASTHITKSIKDEWTTWRVEFDPTLLCKYGAKSYDDFLTQ